MFSYPRFEIDPGDPIHYLPIVAGIVLLGFLWRNQQRMGRAPIAAALFFVTSLGPMLGFIPLYTFGYTFVADHYQYVASIGPIALFASGLARLQERWAVPRGGLIAGAAALLLVIGILTSWQCRIYENRETLWRDTIAKHPQSWMAHSNLGRYLLGKKRWPEAVESYRAALEVKSDNFRAHIGIAEAMMATGRPEEARRHYETALALDSDLPAVHRKLAALAWRRGEGEVAIIHDEAVARLKPDSAKAHFMLGRGFDRLGRRRDAIQQYRRVLALDPSHEGASRALSTHREP
jgi:tetratricopeptide (TPR) repeat protein